ncbi:MAG: hypothetical protein MT490_18665 [Sphingomonas sp.]|uniref:hypothetical protein n=1 Tax=Sphingomonas sp. TaxID=28214 RepID=UPI0022745F44|nr:hypothetical protein [Sphingomonas sp.]MCX8477814.1 hypothetical protein [Sphingomonas sp.]
MTKLDYNRGGKDMTSLTGRSQFAASILAVGALLYAAPAAAQATRTWVSGVGDDANPCSRTAPCKTFAGAISKTATGGEINCLDPAGYGVLTVTKSITVDCTGTFGSVLNSGGGNGLTINDSATATPGTIKVVLRGLSVNGAGTTPGLNGIRFVSGASLTVENITISNQASPNGSGILFSPAAAAKLFVNNVTIVDTGNGATGSGIELAPAVGGLVRAHIHNARLFNNSNNGIRLNTTNGAVVATIEGTEISGGGQGVVVLAPANGGNAMVVDTAITNNTGTGVLAAGTAGRVRVGNTTITGNGTGVSAVTSAIINTYGNNRLNGNGTDGTFTAPAIPQQ